MPFTLSPRLIGMIGGTLAVVAFVWLALHWRSEMIELRGWQTEVVAATRDASANPKLGKDGVARQISLLGQSIADCKAGLAKQNAEVDRLGVETKRQQEAAAIERKRALKRAEKAEGVADRLMASSRAGERLARPCEPSEELQGAWQ